MKNSIPIVFFGSGPVSQATLNGLAGYFDFEAIVTKPATAELMRTAAPGVPVLTAKNRAELDRLIRAEQIQSRLGILVDFGIIISQDVIDSFRLGIINSHFSLLPEWRGADPITFAVLSGQKRTGVSLMLITAGLDEGPILAQNSLELPPDITGPRLTDDLIKLSNSMLMETVAQYAQGKITPKPQDLKQKPTYSQKLTKADGRIDWTKPAVQLEREVRAFLGWPGSFTTLFGKDVTVLRAHVEPKSGRAGESYYDKSTLGIYCGKDALIIDELKPAGKKVMSGADFARGYGRLTPPDYPRH